jgi:hypothetical protein
MMAYRYTKKDLDGAVRGLNIMAGFTAEEADAPLWTPEGGTNLRAKVGRYYVSGAYGGWKLVQIVSEGGAERSITSGYRTKREVYELIHAYREGMAAGKVDDRYTLEALRAGIPAYRAERAAYAAKVEAAREKVGA